MTPQFPPLAGNQSIQMESAVNPYSHGAERRLPARHGRQPDAAMACRRSRRALSDDEVAAVVTYIRLSWGNRGTPVSARQANELRAIPLN